MDQTALDGGNGADDMSQQASIERQSDHKAAVKTPLLDALRTYDATNRLRFHVPGHAGKALAEACLGPLPGLSENIFRYDLTELEGLDVLSEPEECLLASQQAAAEAFGVANSFYLVNGASVGLTAGMLASLKPGDGVLLPRNVHRSIVSGLVLTGAMPIWMLPEYYEEAGIWGAISPAAVEAELSHNGNIRLLILTSPTYEGIGSDIPAILQVCRRYGVSLIIDEAHGSLWPFSDRLPKSACHLPCDLVIHSLHKTAGSLTQSAIAHLPHGSTFSTKRFQEALNTLQTTSPSYLLLASLEASRAFLQSEEGQTAMENLLDRTHALRAQFNQQCQSFQIYSPAETAIWDPTKLWVRHIAWPGNQWAPEIEALGAGNGQGAIAYENATPFGALYLCGLGLSEGDYTQFLETFQLWDKHDSGSFEGTAWVSHGQSQLAQQICLPDVAVSPREAFFAEGEEVYSPDCVGRISRQTIVHCPPGVPVLMPGERVSEAHLPHLGTTSLEVVCLTDNP